VLRNLARQPSLAVGRLQQVSRRAYAVAVAAVVTCVLLAGCGGDPGSGGASADGPSTPPGSEDLDRVVSIEGNRGLYIRCTGSGSPTVIMEGGDEDTSDSYAYSMSLACPAGRTV
jgi:hypothetical protein